MKKKLWLICLGVGLLPFLICLIGGIYAAVCGFGGLTIGMKSYGIEAMLDWVLLWSFVYWPSYVIGIIFIIVSLMIKRRSKKIS